MKYVSADGNGLPVFVYLRREIIGIDDFAKTTLQMLGLEKGRAILRLVHRLEVVKFFSGYQKFLS